jgi:hypothetical protein
MSSKFIRAGSDEGMKLGIKKTEIKKPSGYSKQVNISSTKESKDKKYSKQSSEKIQRKETIVNSSSTNNVGNVGKEVVTKFIKNTTATTTPTLKKNKI